MRLLLDTNILLETAFAQERAAETAALINDARHELFISDFTLPSIGVHLLRRRGAERWRLFPEDLILSGQITVLVLPNAELPRTTDAAELYRLDFDDADQYVVAEHYELTLVSFDGDFDRTPRRCQTPQAINLLTESL